MRELRLQFIQIAVSIGLKNSGLKRCEAGYDDFMVAKQRAYPFAFSHIQCGL
jgi:hypothetical protein